MPPRQKDSTVTSMQNILKDGPRSDSEPTAKYPNTFYAGNKRTSNSSFLHQSCADLPAIPAIHIQKLTKHCLASYTDRLEGHRDAYIDADKNEKFRPQSISSSLDVTSSLRVSLASLSRVSPSSPFSTASTWSNSFTSRRTSSWKELEDDCLAAIDDLCLYETADSLGISNDSKLPSKSCKTIPAGYERSVTQPPTINDLPSVSLPRSELEDPSTWLKRQQERLATKRNLLLPQKQSDPRYVQKPQPVLDCQQPQKGDRQKETNRDTSNRTHEDQLLASQLRSLDMPIIWIEEKPQYSMHSQQFSVRRSSDTQQNEPKRQENSLLLPPVSRRSLSLTPTYCAKQDSIQDFTFHYKNEGQTPADQSPISSPLTPLQAGYRYCSSQPVREPESGDILNHYFQAIQGRSSVDKVPQIHFQSSQNDFFSDRGHRYNQDSRLYGQQSLSIRKSVDLLNNGRGLKSSTSSDVNCVGGLFGHSRENEIDLHQCKEQYENVKCTEVETKHRSKFEVFNLKNNMLLSHCFDDDEIFLVSCHSIYRLVTFVFVEYSINRIRMRY